MDEFCLSCLTCGAEMVPVSSAASQDWFATCSKAPGCRYKVALASSDAVKLHQLRSRQKAALTAANSLACSHCQGPASVTFGVASTSAGKAHALILKCDSPKCAKVHAIDSSEPAPPAPTTPNGPAGRKPGAKPDAIGSSEQTPPRAPTMSNGPSRSKPVSGRPGLQQKGRKTPRGSEAAAATVPRVRRRVAAARKLRLDE